MEHPAPHPHHPPHHTEPENPNKTRNALIGTGVVALAGLAAVLYFFAPEPSHPLRVEVFLDKHCELIDSAFIAVSEPDGARAVFDQGVAMLNTYSDSKIYVKANAAQYPGFEIQSSKTRAAPKVVITVNCSTGRVERTLDAMRQQFRSKER